MLGSCNGCNNGSQHSTAVSPIEPTAPSTVEGFTEFSPGSRVPEIAGTTVTGEKLSLSALRGKTVLINFWATWCIPCVAEMPSLERVYKKFKDREFVVLGVSVDQEGSLVQEFLKQNGVSFPVMLDSDFAIVGKFGVSGFPETFFVSPEGTLLKTTDPETQREGVRIISDRAWDSPEYLAFIEKLLPPQ